MAGAGRRTFSAGEVLTASMVQDYLQDQAVMSFAGTAARASAIPSPSAGMVTHIGGGTVQVYNGTAWVALGGVPNAVLSNTPTGTYTSGGTAYAFYTFTASGTATVTTAGFADVLVVGGGGSGGRLCGGGGGGGGYLEFSNAYLPAGSLTVTVGGGGAAPTGTLVPGVDGNASALDKFVAAGGGGGGSYNGANPSMPGLVGGSGGGGGYGGTGGSAMTTQGSAGGNGNNVTYFKGGGGGGSSAVGGNASGSTAGAGGNGTANTYTGSSVTYSGGGGGGINGGTAGTGGTGGGAAGTANNTKPTAATVNTGGGGGGGGYASADGAEGGNGGSGIVIIRVRT